MPKSELNFAEGFTSSRGKNRNQQKVFDWDKAAELIKKYYKEDSNIVVEAGLDGDWDYTGGIIFEESKPTTEHYTYLSSNWAIPILWIKFSNSNKEDEEIPCWITGNTRFNSESKWDEQSLKILQDEN